jgi:glyceraldehyde 3-phosphate dehydrogenase
MTSKKVLGINGMGRIGKLTLWHHVGRKYFDSIIVNLGRKAATGMADLIQSIEKDSTYGNLERFLYGIKGKPLIRLVDEDQGRVEIDGIPVQFTQEERNPIGLDWNSYNAQMVIDTTGKFRDPSQLADVKGGSLRGHLEAGTRLVIVSAPFKYQGTAIPADAATLIYGVNHKSFKPGVQQMISAASCTTTALAHMVKPLLEDELTQRIITASMSTVHAATNTQSTLDTVPRSNSTDLRKNRSALNNIILTSTGAAQALELAIPEIRDIGFLADSVRVPVQTGSLIILNCTFSSKLDSMGGSLINRKHLLEIFRKASQKGNEGLIKLSMEQNVSSDQMGIDAAVVIEGQATHTRTGMIKLDLNELQSKVPGNLPGTEVSIPVTHAKIFGWYDNEYGSYVNRLGDLACYLYEQVV